jgi:DHA1 family multidrug resistance protein-like MFS transporter
MAKSLDTEQQPSDQQKLRIAALWSNWQISANLLWAYTGALAVDLGASGLEQSLVTAVQTVGNSSLQGVWGSLSDRFGRRPLLFLGLLAVGMTAALIPLARTAVQLILLLLVPTIIGSAAIPAWNGLLGDLTTIHGRGRFVGIITAVGTVSSAIALVIIGFVATTIGLSGIAQYQVPLYVSAVIMIIAIVCIFTLRETVQRTKRHLFNFRKASKGTHQFGRFLFINGIFFAAMGGAWPLFPIITRGILGLDLFQIGMLTALFSLCSGLAQITGGWLCDNLGRKPVIFISRFLIFLAPLSHALGALTGNIWFLVPSNVFGGFLTGLFIVSSTTWLLDSAPKPHRGSIVALFNMVTGVASFLAALASGFILDTLSLIWYRSLVVILMMAAIVILRILTSFGYLIINETLVKKAISPIPAVAEPIKAP